MCIRCKATYDEIPDFLKCLKTGEVLVDQPITCDCAHCLRAINYHKWEVRTREDREARAERERAKHREPDWARTVDRHLYAQVREDTSEEAKRWRIRYDKEVKERDKIERKQAEVARIKSIRAEQAEAEYRHKWEPKNMYPTWIALY